MISNIILLLGAFAAFLTAIVVYASMAKWKGSIEGRALMFVLIALDGVLFLTFLTVILPLTTIVWLIISAVAYTVLAASGAKLARVIFNTQISGYRRRKAHSAQRPDSSVVDPNNTHE